VDAALALNGFEDYGRNGVVEFGFEIRDVVETNKFNAGHERRKGQAVFFGGGYADGAKVRP